MMRLPAHIEQWSDERRACNGITVVLSPGWSFLANSHQRSRTFASSLPAKEASRRHNVFQCKCTECAKTGKGTKP